VDRASAAPRTSAGMAKEAHRTPRITERNNVHAQDEWFTILLSSECQSC
jgi:hypothetical protein